MCGGLHTAAGNLRFDSFLTAENVVLMLIYEARTLTPTLTRDKPALVAAFAAAATLFMRHRTCPYLFSRDGMLWPLTAQAPAAP
jgi:hypothetical protein